MQGWFTWFGWVSLECGIANITAIMVQQMVMLNHHTYDPKNWHITMIMIAMLLIHGSINSTRYTFALVPWLELLAGVLYVCLFVVYMCGEFMPLQQEDTMFNLCYYHHCTFSRSIRY